MNKLYAMFATDKQVERDGVWLNFGPVSDEPGAPEMKIKVARAGGANATFDKRRDTIFKPYRHQIQHGLLDEAVAQSLMRQLYAEAVVLGWENISDRDGNPMECTAENATRLFEDLPDFYEAVKQMANEAALFRETLREADAKN